MESGKDLFESLSGDRVMTFEFEAAEALAGLAGSLRDEIERRCCPSKIIEAKAMDQATGAKLFSENTSIVSSSPVKTADTVCQTCVMNHPSKASGSSRHKLTDAEKEAQKLHRILANRESARQTIRRRQAMRMELTAKAAHLTEENAYLKKEKELAMKKYNCLKAECQFLKVEVAKRKQTEPEETRNPCSETSHSAAANAAATSNTHNHPSLVPLIWPCHLPSLDYMNSLLESSEFFRSIVGQKCSTGQQTPIFILPVPCLLPFNTNCCIHDPCLGTKDIVSSLSHEVLSSVEPSSSRINSTSYNPLARLKLSSRDHKPSEASRKHMGVGSLSLPSKHRKYSSVKSSCRRLSLSPSSKPSNVGAATEARRRRKEVMRLRNVQGQGSHLPQMSL